MFKRGYLLGWPGTIGPPLAIGLLFISLSHCSFCCYHNLESLSFSAFTSKIFSFFLDFFQSWLLFQHGSSSSSFVPLPSYKTSHHLHLLPNSLLTADAAGDLPLLFSSVFSLFSFSSSSHGQRIRSLSLALWTILLSLAELVQMIRRKAKDYVPEAALYKALSLKSLSGKTWSFEQHLLVTARRRGCHLSRVFSVFAFQFPTSLADFVARRTPTAVTSVQLAIMQSL